VRKDIVDAAHALGVEVHYWVINDPGRMIELLELGADGVMSDDPALLARVAREWERARVEHEAHPRHGL
jgi:glycerophosphoryl diester phosphodiesterase